MLGKHPFTRVKFDVAVKDKAGIAYHGNRAAVDLAALHVILVQVLVIIGIETAPCYFVETYHVALFDQAWLRRIHVAHKKLGNGDGTSGQERTVGAELGEAEGFPRLTRTQFDHMVVTLHKRNHAHKIEQLDALRNLGVVWLIAHGAN